MDYTKAIHLDPTNTQIYIYRGQIIFEMGNQDLAAFCVQHAAFINEKSSSSSQSGGGGGNDIFGSNTNSKASFNSLNTSSRTQPLPNATVNALVTQQALVFSFLKNYPKAINILEHELRLKPACSVFNLLGRVLMKSKKWQEAAETFEKSIETAVCFLTRFILSICVLFFKF